MYSKRLWLSTLVVALFVNLNPALGQPDSPVIDAVNIDQLAPVMTLDFEALPPEAGTIVNGRMYVSSDGRDLAVINRNSQIVFLSDQGELLHVTDSIPTGDGFPATFIDGAFDPSGQWFGAIHTAGSAFAISLYRLGQTSQIRWIQSEDKPAGIWLDSASIWLEVVPADPDTAPYLVQIPYSTGDIDAAEVAIFPLVLAEDRDAVVRIGRLPPPLAVTANEEGRVSRWDLSLGKRTGQAQVDDVPIYGAMTPDGRYLGWRDPASQALHRLDFDNGTDQVVTSLRGAYVPFILLTSGGDVILGIDVDGQPIVAAWDTSQGTEHRLGLYRQCQRPPDMVSLTLDGRSVVIGCDVGLQIWRVVAP